MSIGLGIFLTALLLVVVWQIDKRKAWKKSLLWFVGVIVVVGGGLFAWQWWENGASGRENAKVVKQIHDDKVQEYWSIKLGMKKSEVKYLKGEPTAVDKNSDGTRQYLRYTQDPSYVVMLNKDDVVTAVYCYLDEKPYGTCESIAGLSNYSSEQDVISRMGAPIQIRGPDEKGKKYLDYGLENRVIFGLERGKVGELVIAKKAPPNSENSVATH